RNVPESQGSHVDARVSGYCQKLTPFNQRPPSRSTTTPGVLRSEWRGASGAGAERSSAGPIAVIVLILYSPLSPLLIDLDAAGAGVRRAQCREDTVRAERQRVPADGLVGSELRDVAEPLTEDLEV